MELDSLAFVTWGSTETSVTGSRHCSRTSVCVCVWEGVGHWSLEASFINGSPLVLGDSIVPQSNMGPLPGAGFLSIEAN